MEDVGSARHEPSLFSLYPTIRILSYSNYQRSTHSTSKWIFRNIALYENPPLRSNGISVCSQKPFQANFSQTYRYSISVMTFCFGTHLMPHESSRRALYVTFGHFYVMSPLYGMHYVTKYQHASRYFSFDLFVSSINIWFKHILFMMKRIGRGLNATRALSWKEYLQGNSLTHTVTQSYNNMSTLSNS